MAQTIAGVEYVENGGKPSSSTAGSKQMCQGEDEEEESR